MCASQISRYSMRLFFVAFKFQHKNKIRKLIFWVLAIQSFAWCFSFSRWWKRRKQRQVRIRLNCNHFSWNWVWMWISWHIYINIYVYKPIQNLEFSGNHSCHYNSCLSFVFACETHIYFYDFSFILFFFFFALFSTKPKHMNRS